MYHFNNNKEKFNEPVVISYNIIVNLIKVCEFVGLNCVHLNVLMINWKRYAAYW
jgi:hypothetical protein